jgi:hypothetical protein
VPLGQIVDPIQRETTEVDALAVIEECGEAEGEQGQSAESIRYNVRILMEDGALIAGHRSLPGPNLGLESEALAAVFTRSVINA